MLPRNEIVKNRFFYLKSTVFTLAFALILISHREFDFIHFVNERQLMEDIPRCGLKPFDIIVLDYKMKHWKAEMKFEKKSVKAE